MAAGEEQKDEFWATTYAAENVDTTKKRLVTQHIEGKYASELFSHCLIQVTSDCRASAERFMKRCGLGRRNIKMQSSTEPGTLVLLYGDRLVEKVERVRTAYKTRLKRPVDAGRDISGSDLGQVPASISATPNRLKRKRVPKSMDISASTPAEMPPAPQAPQAPQALPTSVCVCVAKRSGLPTEGPRSFYTETFCRGREGRRGEGLVVLWCVGVPGHGWLPSRGPRCQYPHTTMAVLTAMVVCGEAKGQPLMHVCTGPVDRVQHNTGLRRF